MQTLDAFRWLLSCSDMDSGKLGEIISVALSAHRVGQRPNRYEPREIKHRQRKYPELKRSRQQRRRELAEPVAQGQEQTGGKKRRKGAGKDRPSGR